MKKKKGPKMLLLISEEADDLRFATEVAKASELELFQTIDPEEWIDAIEDDEPPAIFVNASTELLYLNFEGVVQDKLGIFSDKINSNAIHFISHDDIDKAPYLVRSPLVGHFVLRNFIDPIEAGQHYARIIRASMGERAFGISNLLKGGTKIQTVKLTVSNQKNDAVEAVRAFASAAKFQDRAASVIANGVDEILLNAIFDAPVDETGTNLHNRVARSTVLQLADQSAVELNLGFDGSYLAVSVVDQYGSVDRGSLFGHISKVYVDEKYQLRTSIANAGLGLATIYRMGGSFLFVSERGKKTEVTLFFKKTHNFREFKDQFRFLSTQFYI